LTCQKEPDRQPSLPRTDHDDLDVVIIANLSPRKMRFGMSEGMILSAGTGGSDLFLLDADTGAVPGATVK
jgi:hypothetical protein